MYLIHLPSNNPETEYKVSENSLLKTSWAKEKCW